MLLAFLPHFQSEMINVALATFLLCQSLYVSWQFGNDSDVKSLMLHPVWIYTYTNHNQCVNKSKHEIDHICWSNHKILACFYNSLICFYHDSFYRTCIQALCITSGILYQCWFSNEPRLLYGETYSAILCTGLSPRNNERTISETS